MVTRLVDGKLRIKTTCCFVDFCLFNFREEARGSINIPGSKGTSNLLHYFAHECHDHAELWVGVGVVTTAALIE